MFLVWCLGFFQLRKSSFLCSLCWLFGSEVQFEKHTWNNLFLSVEIHACICVHTFAFINIVIDRI